MNAQSTTLISGTNVNATFLYCTCRCSSILLCVKIIEIIKAKRNCGINKSNSLTVIETMNI